MFTQETDYAFRTILYLSQNGQGVRVNAQTISEEVKIPHRFLLKFLQKLKQAGLVESFMGVHGGYALAKDPYKISLLDVVEAVDGPVAINRCLINPELCNRKGTSYCPVHSELNIIQEKFTHDLRSVTFGAMLE